MTRGHLATGSGSRSKVQNRYKNLIERANGIYHLRVWVWTRITYGDKHLFLHLCERIMGFQRYQLILNPPE